MAHHGSWGRNTEGQTTVNFCHYDALIDDYVIDQILDTAVLLVSSWKL